MVQTAIFYWGVMVLSNTEGQSPKQILFLNEALDSLIFVSSVLEIFYKPE